MGMKLRGRIDSRRTIEHEEAIGISGACTDEGKTYLVGERNRRLFELDGDNLRVYSIVGLSSDDDLEGLACADGKIFASTESEDEGRSSDTIVEMGLQGNNARVLREFKLEYPGSLKAGSNQGLEGLCIAGDYLLAAGELLRTTDTGIRQAPILQQHFDTKETEVFWVNLSSMPGKLSSLDCRMRGSIVEVFAIERDYDVSRVLQFELDESPVIPQTVLVLDDVVRKTENFEGITVDERGEVRLYNDNQHHAVTGPSEESTIFPIAAFARKL